MIDSFTYFIYIILLLILMLLTGYKQIFASTELSFDVSPKFRIQHFVALILVSLIVGLRYKVGIDWEGYKTNFEFIKVHPHLHFTDQQMEPGFFLINKIIAKAKLSYEWMFLIMAAITWYFLFKSLPKFLLPLFIFFLFTDEYFFWGMNGVRQFAAISIWLFSIKYIIKKDFLKYAIIILFGSLFHRSILILLIFYFIPYIKLNYKFLWLSLFGISFIIGSSNYILNIVESIILLIGQKIGFIGVYSRYIEINSFIINQQTHQGLGFIFKIIINLLIIFFSGNVIKLYPQTAIYFILFFIGTILFNMAYNIQLLGRFNNYFLIMRPLLLSIIVWHFWKIPKLRIPIVGFCALYFSLFLIAIYNSSNLCSPYQFSFLFK